jgi:ADP-ribosyl-[dinitrogen reductase] hydrolase
MRTTVSYPIQIAGVQPFEGSGRIGITFCPGKLQPGVMSGSWQRDLGINLDAVTAAETNPRNAHERSVL